jgi:hypothetical protein
MNHVHGNYKFDNKITPFEHKYISMVGMGILTNKSMVGVGILTNTSWATIIPKSELNGSTNELHDRG